MMRFAEFFEAEDGRMSMTRLVVLLTWPPATYVLIKHPDQLVNYLGAYVASYAAGKASDIFMKGNNNVVSDKMVETDSYSVSDSDSVSVGVQDGEQGLRSKRARGKGRGF